jgi:hypothetical protein
MSSQSFGPAEPAIDIWYGDKQRFGRLGNPQRWVNILGRVRGPAEIVSLSYSLNDGHRRPLSMGADIRRLLCQGDFNIDIDRADLRSGPNTVTITAADQAGNTVTRQVAVEYVSGNVWPTDYEINWSNVSNIQDVAQVVDGWWELKENCIRPIGELGYDRLVAVGDETWTDYEMTVGMTIHSVDFSGRWPPAVGVLLRWVGHYEDGQQPCCKYWPFGAICWYHWRSWQDEPLLKPYLNMISQQGDVIAIDTDSPGPEMDVPYWLKARVETGDGPTGLYSFKVWRQDQGEPGSWSLTAEGAPGALDRGCALLLSHHVDVSFGKVVLKPL